MSVEHSLMSLLNGVEQLQKCSLLSWKAMNKRGIKHCELQSIIKKNTRELQQFMYLLGKRVSCSNYEYPALSLNEIERNIYETNHLFQGLNVTSTEKVKFTHMQHNLLRELHYLKMM